MIPAICIAAATCLLMILGVLFFPKLKLGRIAIDTYWPIALLGAILMVIFTQCDLSEIGAALLSDSAVNPLKILVLFLAMTVLSVYLDELGFFRYLAAAVLERAKGQKSLFFTLYAMVSVLTVFTSNDIIILSFTPFLCYFAEHAGIDPVPYLAAEFVAANTWSMALVIGNPTNIYLATAYGIDFVSYLTVSVLPTLAAGLVALGLLYLLFRKHLSKPITGTAENVPAPDRLSLILGLIHLGVCTVLLAVSSFLGIEMWIVSVCALGSLFLSVTVCDLVRKRKPKELGRCLGRAPYPLVPFVLSMFVMIVALSECGVTAAIGEILSGPYSLFRYGAASFFASNLINNIPMSVLFATVLEESGGALPAVYATIFGSNLGALLTPVGALAGIMFSNLLHHHGVKFGYRDFLRLGVCVAVPSLAAALGVLALLV